MVHPFNGSKKEIFHHCGLFVESSFILRGNSLFTFLKILLVTIVCICSRGPYESLLLSLHFLTLYIASSQIIRRKVSNSYTVKMLNTLHQN